MTAHTAYHITHIPLHKQQTLPELDYNKKGNYLVFWWKSIALGQMFVQPDNQLTEEEYHNKLLEAIQPAVELYMNQPAFVSDSWQRMLLDNRYEEWVSLMENTFATHLPDNVPQKVPVSVLICTRNRAAYLNKCLDMLHKLSCLPEEIIVVDNAPDNDQAQEVVQQYKGVKYVREPRKGLDIARNTGIEEAQCPFVAFVDDDVSVHDLWLYQVWATFQEPATAAMTGLVIASELQTEAQMIFEKNWSFNRGYTDKIYDTNYFESNLQYGAPVWRIGAGANMAFRRDIFNKVGYFDELLDVGAAGCNGDSEMWYRILANGYSIHYNPRAVVYHEHRKEIEGLKKQIFYYMRGFTTAALVQQDQNSKVGYNKRLYKYLPKHYLKLIKRGFPFYRSRFQTVWVEIQGILSGLAFYYRNRSHFSKNLRK